MHLNVSEKIRRTRLGKTAVFLVVALASSLLLISWLLAPKKSDPLDTSSARTVFPREAPPVAKAGKEVGTVHENEPVARAQDTAKSNATLAPSAIRAVEDIEWQYQYGFRVPERYQRLTESELLRLAHQGDGVAAQMLASKIWERTGSREEAAKYYEQAIERGSVGAIAELVSMYDTTMNPAVAKYYQEKLGRPLEPDLQEAYVWARTATYRGDLDAGFAIDRLRNVLTPKEITTLEQAAFENFIMLKTKYKQITGRTLLPMDSDAQRELFSRAAGVNG